jgi:hypothetical protein
VSERVCESCGMPMRQIQDFGGQHEKNKYCRYCTNEKGELKDFETKFQEMVSFITSRMNVSQATAERVARENMAKMPAWKNYF